MPQLSKDQRLFLLQKDSTIKIFFTIILLALNGEKFIGNKRIAEVSSKSMPTVREALAQLEGLELVSKTGRYNAWALTQFGLQFLEPGASSEKFFHSLPSSSRDLIIDIDNKSIKDKTTNKPPKEKTLLSPDQQLSASRLKLSGVGNPARDELAVKHGFEYIETFCNAIDQKLIDRALAIWRMKNDFDTDSLPEPPAPKCDACGMPEEYGHYDNCSIYDD